VGPSPFPCIIQLRSCSIGDIFDIEFPHLPWRNPVVEQVIDFLEGAVLEFRDIKVAPDCSEQGGPTEDEADFAPEVRFVRIDLERASQ
jgi:hypothetical protein